MKHTTLKPNGISHTVYPDQPCTDFHEWSAYITGKEIEREADQFKVYCDNAVAEFERDIQKALKEFQADWDALWADFKKSISE